MIFINSKLNVSDNSGARIVKCIHVYNRKNWANIGDQLLISIFRHNPKKKLKRGELHKAIVVRTKYNLKENTGYISFQSNSVVLLNKKNIPIGTRLFGSTSKKLRTINKKLFLMIQHSF